MEECVFTPPSPNKIEKVTIEFNNKTVNVFKIGLITESELYRQNMEQLGEKIVINENISEELSSVFVSLFEPTNHIVIPPLLWPRLKVLLDKFGCEKIISYVTRQIELEERERAEEKFIEEQRRAVEDNIKKREEVIKLNLTDRQTGRKYVFYVNRMTQISEIRRIFARSIKENTENIDIFYGEIILSDGKEVDFYNIENNADIVVERVKRRVVFKPRPPPVRIIKANATNFKNGRKRKLTLKFNVPDRSIDVKLSTFDIKVNELLLLGCNTIKQPAMFYNLYYGKVLLDKCKTITSYQVVDDATINFVVEPRFVPLLNDY